MADNLLFWAHVAAFAVAAVASFASVARARAIEDPETRRGLTWLLLFSGAWGAAHVGFLVLPSPALKSVAYSAGLIVGIAAVGPWLYFCSAYTGRRLHRDPMLRRLAVTVFLLVVAVKLTNPVHGLYYTLTLQAEPFSHLGVENGLLHWLAMGLAYALATVGYFMLLERLLQTDFRVGPFAALVAVTGIPLALDILGSATPWLIDITYEPLGVAAFAVGVLYVYADQFEAIRLAPQGGEAVVVLSEDGVVRDRNARAIELFPMLEDPEVVGRPLDEVVPTLTGAVDREQDILPLDRQGSRRYYRLTVSAFGADQAQLGRIITLTDVTERESYRRELERQNERLEDFASLVSHDLRNPLTVAMGRLELAQGEVADENLEAVARAHDRMEELIEDLLALARQGQPIDEVEPVELAELAQRCWGLVDQADAELHVEGELSLLADPDRLQQLIENLLRNAIEHGGDDVTITVGPLEDGAGFYLADDGPGIPSDDLDQVFESGFTTAEGGTGFGLAIVREIAEAHDWTIRAVEADGGGARFEIRGVERPA
ncbi:MAG: ATP-binding protein [Halobacteriales archaeon]|nr:ATP-binding protein [Halobacteriales archaeon]